jgi:chemotaxis protein MotB
MAEGSDDNKPIIIIKKGGHGGHHGGAWKIAYADFTTAMMCFFLCMWLINTASVTVRVAIASYFRRPSIFQEGSGQPLLLGGQGILDEAYVPPREKDPRKFKDPLEDQKTFGETERDLDKLYMQEGKVEPFQHRGPTNTTGLNTKREHLRETREELKIRIIERDAKQEIERMANAFASTARLAGSIEASAEPDGLKIEIMDTDKQSMFDSGSARIRNDAIPAFKLITDVIKRYPNTLEVFGHTDAEPFPTRNGGYTNWELSSDRANSARRMLERLGYPPSRITSVSGRASSELRKPDEPLHPSNRRITLKLKFSSKTNFTKDSGEDKGLNDPLRKLLDEEAEKTAKQLAEKTPEPDTPTPSPTPTPIPTLSTLSTNKKVQVPEMPSGTMNPDYMPTDKIFGDIPVVGSNDILKSRP